MNDDLNTAIALSVIFELVRVAGRLLEDSGVTAATLHAVDDLFTKLGGDVLGIVLYDYPQTSGTDDAKVDKIVQILIEQRSQARKNKNFAQSDAIRDQLGEADVVLEDKPGLTTWRWK